MKRIPVILDGDPGHDDAIAWVLANSRPELNILAVSTAAGNQTLAKTTYNAGRIMALIGLDVPLAAGRRKPLFGELIVAPSVHGVSGLDGPALPEPVRPLEDEDAVSFVSRVLEESPEPVALVSTGPLTNTAALLLLRPDLKNKIGHIYMMGGGITKGNWTPAAEFNILVDPEAADIVFRSGLPITMAGLDVTENALVYPEDIERIRCVGNEVSRVVAEWLTFFYGFHQRIGYAGAPVHDAVAVAALVRPDLFTFEAMHVEVELCGDYARGATVGDRLHILKQPPNVSCIMGLNRERFVDLLVEAVAFYGKEPRA